MEKRRHLVERLYRHPEPSEQNLVAYYKLWAGLTGATTVFDYTLNGLVGTVTGTDCEPAYEGFSFNGTDDKIDVGTGPASVKSLTIWMKVADIDGNEYPIDLNGTDYLSIVSGAVTVNGFTGEILYVDAEVATSGVTAIAADTFAFIVITATTAANADNFDIGAGGQAWFEGKIGEVRLYSSVLTVPEIKSIYELTKWRYQP